MGRLVTPNELSNLGLSWYFPEYTDNMRLKLPAGDYQHMVAIQKGTLRETPSLKVDARKFIEESISCLVIHTECGRNYKHFYPWSMKDRPRYDWDSTEVEWTFVAFWFDNEPDALMFKMRFSEHVSPVTEYDPARPPSHLQEAEWEAAQAEKDLAKAKKKLETAKAKYDYDNERASKYKTLEDNDFDDDDEYISALDKYEEELDIKEEIFNILCDNFDDDIDEDLIYEDANTGKTFKCLELDAAIRKKKTLERAQAVLQDIVKTPFKRW